VNTLFHLTRQAMTRRPAPSVPLPSAEPAVHPLYPPSCPSHVPPPVPASSPAFSAPHKGIYSQLMKNHDRMTQRHLSRT